MYLIKTNYPIISHFSFIFGLSPPSFITKNQNEFFSNPLSFFSECNLLVVMTFSTQRPWCHFFQFLQRFILITNASTEKSIQIASSQMTRARTLPYRLCFDWVASSCTVSRGHCLYWFLYGSDHYHQQLNSFISIRRLRRHHHHHHQCPNAAFFAMPIATADLPVDPFQST